MVTQRLNPRNVELEEEKKEIVGIGIGPNLSNGEATQNLELGQHFQPEMTANFVPQDFAGALEGNENREGAGQRQINEAANISTQRANDALQLRGLQSQV